MASKGSEMSVAERPAFPLRDTSTDEYKRRALRPLDLFEATLRPNGDGPKWLAIRSSRRCKTVQKVGWWARTFASSMPASAAKVKLVFPTATLRVAETPALTPATTSASACNSSTQPVRKNQSGTQSLLPHFPRNHLQSCCPAETPEQHNRKTVHCWQGSRTRRFHHATDDCASCVTRPQVRGAPTPKRWACRPTTLPSPKKSKKCNRPSSHRRKSPMERALQCADHTAETPSENECS
ncbi:hypothetical protein TcCL_Unassigned05710 [Trypanosoma cruzi]|nr:hypothetical protein TcCL_Unassigned05710 [Trypanosoma cruzi]